ncbi:MAG: DUF302 domain-containing protein [Gammaproteobacteria bacterium]
MKFLCFILGAALLSGGTQAVADGNATVREEVQGTILRATTGKSFADVVQELEFAITEHNFRITGRNTIGKGLRDRGYADFPDVEVIHFCSLETAREVLLLDRGYVALMPCRVSVHESDAGTVMSMVLLPESHPDPRVAAFARRMNGVLREILAFVLEAEVR